MRTTAIAGLLCVLVVSPGSACAQGDKVPFTKKTYTYKTIGETKIEADVYRPDDKQVRPVLVWIHGGALIMGGRNSVPKQLMDLCRTEGYALVSLDYRLAPETKLRGIIVDIQNAFLWLRTQGPKLLHIDPERVVVSGGSAGGYLTLMTGICVTPSPKALVSYWGYGDVDGDWYTKPSEHYRKSPLVSKDEAYKAVGGGVPTDGNTGKPRGRFYLYCRQNGLWTREVTGFDPEKERAKLDPFCPVRNVTPAFPPTIMIHGTADTDVPYELSADMAKELTRHKVVHELVTVEGGRHGLGGGDKKVEDAAHAKALAFIRQYLKPAAAPPAKGGDMVRIGSGVSGHIHPAACVAKSGTILVIYCQKEAQDMRLSRSSDGGRTWSPPAPVPPTEKLSMYPGSLTTLHDGRILHAWNTWYADPKTKGGKSRFVQYSLSADEGKTWSAAKSLPKNPESHSVLRHAIVELGSNDWLFSLTDKTIVYDPRTEQVTVFGDGRVHGLVPMVRTIKGTLVSGSGQRSIDGGKTWQGISPFPKIDQNGWRFDLVALKNGWLVASEVLGPGVGGDSWRFVVSRDDGQSWDLEHPVEFYNPGRPIGGRACPKTVQLDADTLGTVFYDINAKQPGGPGVFFLRTPLAKLGPALR